MYSTRVIETAAGKDFLLGKTFYSDGRPAHVELIDVASRTPLLRASVGGGSGEVAVETMYGPVQAELMAWMLERVERELGKPALAAR